VIREVGPLSVRLSAALSLFAGALAFAGMAAARPAPESFRGIVKRLSPTVVNISAAPAAIPAAKPGGPVAGLDRSARERISGGSAQGEGQSLGSGFIIDSTGYIVTNRHVVAGARAIAVTLANGQKLPAALVGADSKTDLALLKVTPRAPLPPVTFADSDTIEPGDWVVAIGNPYGLGGSVSAGIVSARDRELNIGSYDDFIQTDAAINSGNSGGPLFNLDGEVVGINSALLSPSGGSVGIGFAISANLARPIIAQLRSFGGARRGWIGVRVQSITPDVADALGLPDQRGALVSNVTPDGPADRAGLQPGDVIMRFDGKEIGAMRSFPRAVAEAAVGKTSSVEVSRHGKPIALKVQVQQLAEKEESVPPVQMQARPSPRGLGLLLSALTPELRQRFAIPTSVAGAVVTAVEPGGQAAENDFRPGDVVVKAGGALVKADQDFQAQVNAARLDNRRHILLGVSRRGETAFKALKLSSR
jgi:serine protease Do